MAVTNTVQGLNCVIDLLKNILDATKSNDDKTVQPRDVSSTSRVTANIQSPTIETEGLNSLNSINKRMENKAKSYVSIIKTITSKDTISGIRTLASLQGLGVLTMFNKAIDSIVNSLNLLNNMKVTKPKVTSFVTVINSITRIITAFTDIIFSIRKVMLAAVGLGALFIIAWPMILLGFIGVTATMIGVLGIIKIMMSIQTILFGGVMNINSVMNVVIFKMMTEIFLYLGGIMLTAAAIGILSTIAAPYILEGFKWMAGVMVGVLAIMWLASKVSESVKFGLLAIGTIIISLYAISLLIFIAAGVGAFSAHFWRQILIGFGWILGITALITLAVLAISNTKDIAVKYNVIVSIGLLAISMIAVGLLVMVMNNVGKTVNDNAKAVFAGMGTMLVLMVALSGLLWVISKIANSINLTSTLKGIGLILLLGITISAMTLVIQSLINVQDKVKTAGGWENVWEVLKRIRKMIWSITIIAGLLGASKSVAIAIGIGLGIIGGITLILLGLSKVIRNIVDTAILIGEANERKAFDGIESAAKSIGSAISTLVKELLPASGSALLLMPAIVPLNMLMNTISKFVRIVSEVGEDPNFMVPTEIDENGNIKTSYAKVNMQLVALNIATAFTSFVETLSSKLKSADIDGLKNAKVVSRLMKRIINPISEFVKVVQSVAKDPNFVTPVELNDDGSVKSSGSGVNIGQVAQNIANTFIILVNSIDKHLSSIEMSGGKIRKLAKMEGVVNAIRGTMELLTKFKVTSVGKTHQITLTDDKGQQRTITAEFSGLNELLSSLNTELKDVKTNNIEDLADLTPNITKFHEEWAKLDNIMFSDSNRKLKVLKEYKETMAELCKVLKDMSESTEKISQMKLPDTNVSENETHLNPIKQQINTSTAVDSQNNNAISNNSFNPSDIADAIKTGLSGSVVKFTFNDSTEDFIADMMLT